MIDYEDYLRVRGLNLWGAEHPRYLQLRQYCRSRKFMEEYTLLLPRLNDEEICNLCITLIYQAKSMLTKLIEKQQIMFLENGGVREQMTRARLDYRDKIKEK